MLQNIFLKNEISKLPVDNTDIFQRNMLDRLIDCPNEHFKNGRYRQIDHL